VCLILEIDGGGVERPVQEHTIWLIQCYLKPPHLSLTACRGLNSARHVKGLVGAIRLAVLDYTNQTV